MKTTQSRWTQREIFYTLLVVVATCLNPSWCFSTQLSYVQQHRLPANDDNRYDIFRRKSKAERASLVALNLSAGPIFSFIPSTTTILSDETIINVASTVIGFGILSGYHLNLILKERQGRKNWRSVQADAREKWSQFVRNTEGWLYAIQTMRNAITAMTFLATTVLSLLTVIAGRLWEVIRSLDATGDVSSRRLVLAQFAAVAICMLSSAYQFLQSARLMTHAGFMFPVERKGTTKVDRIMRKSQNAQWLGLRFLYVSLAILSWIVGGPRVFCVASLLLSLFFRKIDQVPEGLDSDYIEYTI